MTLLLIIILLLVVVAFVAPHTGHPLPGGNLIGFLLVLLFVILLVYLLLGSGLAIE
jgi:hypothetical protein